MQIEIMESSEIIKQLSHFSHRHPLEFLEVEERDGLICSGCEVQLSGTAAYGCTKPTCDFILHDSCIDLPRELRHASHPKHRLILHSHPPYAGGEFGCKACGNPGHGFTYHCAACKFDLHVGCASLPEVEHREDHEHPFLLSYSSFPAPTNDDGKGKGKGKAPAAATAEEETSVCCYVCRTPVEKGPSWLYHCSGCHYGAHLDCVSN